MSKGKEILKHHSKGNCPSCSLFNVLRLDWVIVAFQHKFKCRSNIFILNQENANSKNNDDEKQIEKKKKTMISHAWLNLVNTTIVERTHHNVIILVQQIFIKIRLKENEWTLKSTNFDVPSY